MGHNCKSVTIHGPSQENVVRYLRAVERETYVSPTVNDATVIYDKASVRNHVVFTDEYRDVLALLLSGYFRCPALFMRVDQSDVLSYHLYENGQLVDRYYTSWPYWLPNNAPGSTAYRNGGNAEALCAAFDVLDASELVHTVLHHRQIWIDDLQQELVTSLKLPAFAAFYRYDWVDLCKQNGGNGCQEEIDWSAFIKVGT